MLKKFTKSKVIFDVTFLMSSIVNAQDLQLSYYDGSESKFNLDEVRKITYKSDFIQLHLKNGEIYDWTFFEVDKFNFNNEKFNFNSTVKKINTFKVDVYPVPAHKVFNFKFQLLKEDIVSIKIFSTTGNLFFEKSLGNLVIGDYLESVNLSTLTKGTYLVCVTNREFAISKNNIKI